MEHHIHRTRLSSPRTLQPKNLTKFSEIPQMYPSIDSIESINRYKTDATGLHLWPEMEKKIRYTSCRTQ